MRSEEFWKYFDSVQDRMPSRAKTFRAMFEHLDRFDEPVMVETGCIEEPDNWSGNGCSTILLDHYVQTHPGAKAISVEIDPRKVAAAKLICPRVQFVIDDSVDLLKALAEGPVKMACGPVIEPAMIDLLYLDASHLDWTNAAPAAAHHLAELLAAMPLIGARTLVVVDDSPTVADGMPYPTIGGKGAYVADYAIGVGADLVFSEYQVGFLGMNRPNVQEDESLDVTVARARAAIEAENVPLAASLYRQIVVGTNPPRTGRARVARGEACAFFAKIAVRNGKLGTAADWYRQASDTDPHAADYRLDLVVDCFLAIGHVSAAVTEAKRAAAVSPDYWRCWKILGICHQDAGDGEKAVEAYDRALQIEPGNADALLDRATIALDLADYAKVTACCQEVLNNGGDRVADAVHCLGMVAYREHRHEAAIDLYDAAIEGNCRDPGIAHWNKSLALHSIGRYREGWAEHEHRVDCKQNPALYLPMRRFKLPRWTGQPPQRKGPDGHGGEWAEKQKLIHVHYEAGAGDNLACARYLAELIERGFRVRYETAPEMVDLMRASFPGVEVVPKAPDYPGAVGIEPFDYHVPIGSLPAVFETEVNTVPWRGPYLRPDKSAVWRFRAAVEQWSAAGRRRVGICWSSGIRTSGIWIKEYGLRKSMHFDATGPIRKAAHESGFDVFNLQVGPERAQASNCLNMASRARIIDLLGARPNWNDTAALIANLDLVVTVDTGVAHLAGAMGKPTFLMCQRDAASWHFMCWREGAAWNERSPWYPQTRVFRQREFDNPHFWGDVVADVAEEIRRWDSQRTERAAE